MMGLQVGHDATASWGIDKSGRFCSPRAARELALSIIYAACLEGSDPVRLFERRVNARRASFGTWTNISNHKVLCSDIEELVTLSPEKILLKWMNFHLKKAGYTKTVTNFSTNLKCGIRVIDQLSFLLSRPTAILR
ncbi:hypothetical protein L1987_66165 [Smallanthus sonchifolius]|uniref:Uncharacterized protein n=1 Tax=Smallanthus sonchifolius TaxID=185202 RepID=A0ACB9BWP8_9ASTR|nr:hypothetical protein L1987_66165 [Smallanthus sonchifolius]